jgi:hypothetical protein
MSNYPGWDYLLDVMEKSAGIRNRDRREFEAKLKKEDENRVGEFPNRLENNPPKSPSGMFANINAGIQKIKYDAPLKDSDGNIYN